MINGDHTHQKPFQLRFQPLMLPSPETLNERFSLLSQRLRLEIKKRLRTWRRDDPDVRIEMEIDRDCFDLLKVVERWLISEEKML